MANRDPSSLHTEVQKAISFAEDFKNMRDQDPPPPFQTLSVVTKGKILSLAAFFLKKKKADGLAAKLTP